MGVVSSLRTNNGQQTSGGFRFRCCEKRISNDVIAKNPGAGFPRELTRKWLGNYYSKTNNWILCVSSSS